MKVVKLLFVIFLIGCNSKTKELPVLSYKVNDFGKKVNYSVTYDDFVNQLNEGFSTETIKDKIFIANFFFTQCPSICPPMRNQLIDIANTFKNKEDFIIISHTIDPKNDSISVLKSYAETTGVSNKKWQFLHSTINNTKLQAKQFMTNFKPNVEGTDFYHSSFVALVDKNQLIRGYYNILIDTEVELLEKDIFTLLKE